MSENNCMQPSDVKPLKPFFLKNEITYKLWLFFFPAYVNSSLLGVILFVGKTAYFGDTFNLCILFW